MKWLIFYQLYNNKILGSNNLALKTKQQYPVILQTLAKYDFELLLAKIVLSKKNKTFWV